MDLPEPVTTKMKRIIIIAIATLATAAVAMAGMTPSAEAFFKTPGGAYCGAEYGMYCWTPNDGFSTQMSAYGRVSKWYSVGAKGFYPRGYRTLRFGQARRYGPVRCSSRHDGLTCVNRGGHGWWLGRWVGYRVF